MRPRPRLQNLIRVRLVVAFLSYCCVRLYFVSPLFRAAVPDGPIHAIVIHAIVNVIRSTPSKRTANS
ncbi:hypothetical protein Pla52n_27710 [Stieleria varia]|uniref:Uncharacterized protein n=1 Tax=Stieleria varia TaxID=2528005 RepID=A0A5C6AYI8_9BACT|nr:hypothetical protein Pla52n_27710 [Stieleria varia]